MVNVIQKIIEAFGVRIANFLTSLVSAITIVFAYLENRRCDRLHKEKKEQDERESAELDEVADNGSLSDLLEKIQ